MNAAMDAGQINGNNSTGNLNAVRADNMSEEQYVKSPCSSCGGNISFPPDAEGMEVQCPHCGTQTTLSIPTLTIPQPEAQQATPYSSEPEPEEVEVKPRAADEAQTVRPKAGANAIKSAKPPPAPRFGVAEIRNKFRPPNPPRSRIKSLKSPPPPPSRRRSPGHRGGPAPGILARSSAGVDAMPRGGIHQLKSLWDDGEEYADILPPNLLRCESCGSKIPKDSQSCPNCGHSISKALKWFRRLGALSILVLAAVAIVNWRAARSFIKPPEIPADQQGVALLHAFMQKEKFGDLIYIRGAVTNNSPVEFFYVKVEFNLLDRDGQIVGKTSDQLNVIGANKIWNFKALILDPDAVGFTNAVASAVR